MDVALGDEAEPGSDERRWSPPDNEVPGTVGDAVVLVADDDAAVVLTGVQHLSTGLLLTLRFLRRVAPPESRFHHGMPDEPYVGVELADGRRVMADQSDGEHILSQRGGGGGGRVFEYAYWLSPAPDGEVSVVVHAVGYGLPEARTVLSGVDLAAARTRVVELWPWAPEPPADGAPPPRPAPPAGGWFDQEES